LRRDLFEHQLSQRVLDRRRGRGLRLRIRGVSTPHLEADGCLGREVAHQISPQGHRCFSTLPGGLGAHHILVEEEPHPLGQCEGRLQGLCAGHRFLDRGLVAEDHDLSGLARTHAKRESDPPVLLGENDDRGPGRSDRQEILVEDRRVQRGAQDEQTRFR